MSQSIVIFLLFAVVQVVSSLAALLFSNIDKLGSGLPLESLTIQPIPAGICLLIGEAIIGAGLWYYYHTEALYRRLVSADALRKQTSEAAQAAEAQASDQAADAPQAAEAPQATIQSADVQKAAEAPQATIQSADVQEASLQGSYLFPTIKRHLPERSITWLRGSIYVLLTIGVALLLGEILSWIGIDDSTEQALFKGMISNPWCLVLLCIVGPCAEELTFRQGIVRGLYRWGLPGWAAALIAAIAFAVIHGNLAQGIPALIVGFIFGLLYLRTGNLKLCLTAHIINNVVAAILI